jgi:hypothetical protein
VHEHIISDMSDRFLCNSAPGRLCSQPALSRCLAAHADIGALLMQISVVVPIKIVTLFRNHIYFASNFITLGGSSVIKLDMQQ